MAEKKLTADETAARIVELEAELAELKKPPFVEYPKMLADGRIVNSAAEEAAPVPAPEDPHIESAKKTKK